METAGIFTTHKDIGSAIRSVTPTRDTDAPHRREFTVPHGSRSVKTITDRSRRSLDNKTSRVDFS